MQTRTHTHNTLGGERFDGFRLANMRYQCSWRWAEARQTGARVSPARAQGFISFGESLNGPTYRSTQVLPTAAALMILERLCADPFAIYGLAQKSYETHKYYSKNS